MNASAADRGQLIEYLRHWLQRLEAGESMEAPAQLSEHLANSESAFYEQVASLTQRLHRAITELRLDQRLTRIVGDTIPDARDRLQHVVGMTEAAAHRTLDLIDATRGATNEFIAAAQRLEDAGNRLATQALDAQAHAELAAMLRGEGTRLQHNAGILRSNLNDMATAQEYQDITGQIIKRVIRLVEEVDRALGELLGSHGGMLKARGEAPIPEAKEALPGPALPGRPAANQQDADALLDSLGF